MTTSGEFALPNYRRFELVLKRQINRAARESGTVSVRIQPSTYYDSDRKRLVTDIVYAMIWVGDLPLIRYKIDCDIA